MPSKRHYIEGDALGGGGVAIQATPPVSGDLWYNTDDRRYSRPYMQTNNARGQVYVTAPVGALYARVNGIFRRSDDGACYPSELYCTRRDLFCGKRCVSRSRAKRSKFFDYITSI